MSLSAVPPAPSTGRLLLAAGAAGAVAVLGVSQQGPAGSYALMMPLLVASGGWLCGRISPRVGPREAPVLLALILLSPSVGLKLWTSLAALDDTHYTDIYGAVHGLLLATRRGSEGAAPLLLAGAIGVALLWARQAAAAVLCLVFAAAGAAAGRAGVQAALDALADGDDAGVARWALLLPFAGLLAPLGAALGWALARLRGRAAALLILLSLAAGWSATPPLWAAEQGFLHGPATAPEVAVPLGHPGPAFAAAPLQALSDLDPVTDDEPPAWRCAGDLKRWWRTPRVSAALALPATASLAELDAWIDALEERRVGRLGLVGRSADLLPGRVGHWMSWPTVGLLLDRPPDGARWAILGLDGARWEGAAPLPGDRASCAFWPEEGLSVGQIFAFAQGLQQGGVLAQCAALAILPPRWRPARVDPGALAGLSCPIEPQDAMLKTRR